MCAAWSGISTTDRVRLLIVSQYFWPESFRVNDLVEGLRARGHEVTVLTGLPNYPEGAIFPDYRARPGDFAAYHGAEVVRVPVTPRGKGYLTLALNYLCFVVSGSILGPWKLRGRSFDAIFVCQLSPITSALPALILRRLKRAPVLMWVLDLWPGSLSATGGGRIGWLVRWLTPLLGRLVSFVYARCDRILIPSRGFSDNILRYAGSTDRVRYFPNWIEPVYADGAEAHPLASELTPFRDTFNVMFAGNVGEAQDMMTVLAAAESVRDLEDVRWLIVGDGRALPELRAEIDRRGLGQRVVLLGRHPTERMPAFFNGADAMLVSLRPDPFMSLTIPGKVQSYMAAGIPILAMLDGEGARVVTESGGGLAAAAGDAAGLAANLRRLHGQSSDQRKAMGQRGRRYAETAFDRDTLFTHLEGWLREAVEEFRGLARR